MQLIIRKIYNSLLSSLCKKCGGTAAYLTLDNKEGHKTDSSCDIYCAISFFFLQLTRLHTRIYIFNNHAWCVHIYQRKINVASTERVYMCISNPMRKFTRRYELTVHALDERKH